MAKTREEALRIIENIGEELNKIYVPKNPVQFSEDPEQRKTEQILLYYKLRRRNIFSRATTDNKREELYHRYMRQIQSGDKLTSYVMNADAEQRQAILEDLVSFDRSDTIVGDMIEDLDNKTGDADRYDTYGETYLRGLFAPHPDSTGMRFDGFTEDTENNFPERMTKAQNEVNAIILPVPEGLNDRIAAMTAFGFFLRDESMGSYHNTAMKIKGSSLHKVGEDGDSGRHLVFENLFYKNDARANLHICREYAPAARRNAVTALEAYAAGDKQPTAEALYSTYTGCITLVRFFGDTRAHYNRMAMKYALEAYDALNTPELAGTVTFTQEEKEWAATARRDMELQNEMAALEKSLVEKCMENFGKPGKPMDDPETRAMTERILMLRTHTALRNKAMDDYLYSSGSNGDKSAIERAHRPLNCYERMMIEKPEAYELLVRHWVEKGGKTEKLEAIDNWNDFCGKVVDIATKNVNGPKYNIFPDRMEGITLRDELNGHLAQVPAGNDRLVRLVQNLSCMNPNKPFPQDPTDKQIRERAEEYRVFFDNVNRMYPNGLTVTMTGLGAPLSVDIISNIRRSINREAEQLNELLTESDDRRVLRNLDRNYDRINEKLRELTDVKGHPADTVSYTDAEGNPVDASDVRRRILEGEKLRVRRFLSRGTVGVSNSLTLNPETGDIKVGPERYVSRVVDYTSPEYTLNDTLVSLRSVRETLRQTDGAFVHNHTQFKELMEKLDEVIKVQETMPADPNIRQVGALQKLYAELDKKKDAYIEYKQPILKANDIRGSVRLDTIRSLGTLTDKNYVSEAAGRTYTRQAQLLEQSREAMPLFTKLKRWNDELVKEGMLTERADISAFCKDFDSFMTLVGDRRAQGKNTDYMAIGMSEIFPRLLKERADDAYVARVDKTVAAWDDRKSAEAAAFARSCEQAVIRYAGMTPDIKPAARAAHAAPQAPELQAEAPNR